MFGKEDIKAIKKEVSQLHQRNCFGLVDMTLLTPMEKRRAVEVLLFLCKKRDGSIKGWMVYNGKPTRKWLMQDETASPKVSLEVTFLTAMIDAKEKCDIMTNDVPNAFIQALIPEEERSRERIIMKITGVLVDLLVEAAPETYRIYVILENGIKTLYVEVLKVLYGMLRVALLWYKKFKLDLEEI